FRPSLPVGIRLRRVCNPPLMPPGVVLHAAGVSFMNRLVMALVATTLALGPSARADNPPAPSDTDLQKTKQTAAFEQERQRRQFNEFQQKLLALAQRYEKSSKPEERERALVLKQAIDL